MSTYRTGSHWGVTIIREPTPEAGSNLELTGNNSELVAVVVNGDQALAERICALLNADEGTPVEAESISAQSIADVMAIVDAPYRPGLDVRLLDDEHADSCTCPLPSGLSTMPEPFCPVHQNRRARGPKPPNPPGCICDGSGRTCPRHGVVL